MSTWVRYKEEKKYKKEADTNVNPKHVGESLRSLTLEDRLELRRQAREQSKKRAVQTELDDDGDDESDVADASGVPSQAPRPVKKAKSTEEVEDLTVVEGGGALPAAGEAEDEEIAVVAEPLARTSSSNGSGKPLARTTSNRSATPDALVVELDEDDAAALAAARRARRRANAAAATKGVQVLE